MLLTYFQIYINPFTKHPGASPDSGVKLYRLFLKTLIPIYLVLDYNNKYSAYFVMTISILHLVLIYWRFHILGFFNSEIDSWIVKSDIFFFWTGLCCTLQAFTDNYKVDNVGLLFYLLGLPVISYCITSALEKHKFNQITLGLNYFDTE